MQPDYEFVEARFIDEDHLNVAVMWKSPENQLVEQVISADPTQPHWNQLMKHTTEKAVWDRTAEWKFEEKKKFDKAMEPYIHAHAEELLKEKYGYVVEELDIKRNEIKNLVGLVEGKDTEINDLASTVNLKDGEVRLLARDNKILVEDVERLNKTMHEYIGKTKGEKEVIGNLETQMAKIKRQLKSNIVVNPGQLFELLIANNKNEEYLFKFKLEAFKLDDVKNSKSKKIKTDIRKTKSIIDLLILLKDKI